MMRVHDLDAYARFAASDVGEEVAIYFVTMIRLILFILVAFTMCMFFLLGVYMYVTCRRRRYAMKLIRTIVVIPLVCMMFVFYVTGRQYIHTVK
jgi:hypothetical protein